MMPALSNETSSPTGSASGGSVRRTSGPAWHERHDGLHVVKLAGSFREMGRQHGELLRDVIPEGPIPYYRSYFEKLIGRAALGPLGPLVWPALQALVGRRVGRNVPRFAEETIRGLAEGAGLRFEDVFGGCTMPDSMLWLAARLQELKAPGPAVVHRLSLGLGCTSALAWGEATRDGKLYHARNFGYHGVSCWPNTQGVFFHAPEEGQRYVSVAAAGVALGGITAMNEAGLTLTVHQHMFTDQTRLGGTPIGAIGDEVMRKAESLDDAERILAANRPIGCWTYVVSDGKTREVLCFEESPVRHRAFRFGGGRVTDPRAQKAKDTFGYANVYLDEELGRTEVNMYGSYWRHNAARHRRANERLAEGAGAHDERTMAGVLADRGLSSCRVSEAISMVMTVGSVVFCPEDGVVWVGTGEAPTRRNRFVAFELHGERRATELPSFVVDDSESAEARSAYEAYRRAYVSHLDDGDTRSALASMTEACMLAPREPVFSFLRGLLALELREHRVADDALSRAIELGHAHPERRVPPLARACARRGGAPRGCDRRLPCVSVDARRSPGARSRASRAWSRMERQAPRDRLRDGRRRHALVASSRTEVGYLGEVLLAALALPFALVSLLSSTVLTSTVSAQEPRPIDRVLDVAVGDAIRGHAGCVARESGPVLCWSGPNVLLETARYFGAMTGPRAQPGTDGVIRVVRGADVLCGVHRDGRVLCWRAGYAAPIGAPVRDAVEIAMSGAQACVLRRDASVACFDASPLPPYLMRGTPPPVIRPHAAPEPAAAQRARSVAVAAGLGCAIESSSGDVACWDLETGRSTSTPPIAQPSSAASFVVHGGAIACVVDQSGAIHCRTGGSGAQPETRFAELGPVRIVHAAVTETTACAVAADGRLACWGPRPRRYTITSADEAERRAAPTRGAWNVPGVSDAVRVAIAPTHVCVVTRSGHARCFGPNESGELGDGTTTESTSPSFVVRHDVLPDPPHHAYGCAATLAQRRSCPRLGDDCLLQPVPGGWDLGPGGGAYCDAVCMARRELALSTLPVPACECTCDPAVLARQRGPAVPPPPYPPSAPPSAPAPSAAVP